MRKPRDYDAELRALDDKAKTLKSRKVAQLGELVIACKADALSVEELAGALLAAATNTDFVTKEEWRKAGEAFFRDGARHARGSRAARQGGAAGSGSATSSPGKAGA